MVHDERDDDREHRALRLGGMRVGTLLGIFFVPLFFVVVQRVFGRHRGTEPAAAPQEGTRAPDLAGG